jgi:hypothetical protein
MRATFFGCCASATTPKKSANVATKIDDRSSFFIAHLVLDATYHARGNCEMDYLRR